MTMSSCKTSEFTFQSSVHSTHVLHCLDEQRQKDLLCDVTLVAENRSFRAHRSVLASCSEYFSTRMTNHTSPGLIINLPDEVTAEGFEPLLQFAYTSKLLFTKENVLEIHTCATVLGFKNLDKACFDFILPKFFDSSKGSSKVQRNQCCKTKCWAAKDKSSFKNDCANDAGDAPSATQPLKKQEPNISNLSEKAVRTCSPCQVETEADTETETDYSTLCPKYRKFQLACGKGLSNQDTEPENTENTCSLNCLPCSSFEKCESAYTLSSKISAGITEEDAALFCCPLAKHSPIETPLNLCSGKTSPQMCPVTASCSLGGSLPPPPPPPPPPPVSAGEVVKGSSVRVTGEVCTVSDCKTGTICPNPRKVQRSSVEMEVANQLSAWPDFCNSGVSEPSSHGQGMTVKSSELQWLKQLECPFLRDLGAVDAQVRRSEVTSHSAECSYISSIHSGEDSDSFDTEGDSESCTSEQASLMQLPFSVEGIVSLSRNDFQQMLKTQMLTREQLEFVHDVRRRSKNRVAARRCRKRKLDCIHNLECEIERLRSEKEKLTAEKRQLDQLRLKTRENYSVLYDRLCAEAKLQPEQLQVFAKYTSLAECPFSTHLSTKAQLYHHSRAELQLLASCLGNDTGIYEPGTSTRSVNTHSLAASNLRSTEPPHTGNSETMSISTDQISKPETDKS
ncbi:transcription regulator protein BACH1b isoform X2 [Tachysurus fulvidraco]|uniref:transcription regulator protein BACH1b isoform X2 n=1 Tax=Tachysurus fulvidraco TaxID=1234273 RepID=UPI001FEFFADC|nr:transcription regulator protein BACH1b isoform X2 [Tachysurus fulvidraco]